MRNKPEYSFQALRDEVPHECSVTMEHVEMHWIDYQKAKLANDPEQAIHNLLIMIGILINPDY